MKEIAFISDEELAERLNPYFLRKLQLKGKMPLYEANPHEIFNASRFDIVAKYIYAKFRAKRIASNFADDLYTEHLRIFNNFVEPDGNKTNVEDFKSSYHRLLDSIKEKGFDTSKSIIPIGLANAPIDGGHRLAASLFYRQKVTVVPFERKNNNFNFRYFRRKGLSNQWCDPIALEFCRLKKSTYILCIFPTSVKNKLALSQMLYQDNRLDLLYDKTVQVTPYGLQNLLNTLNGKNASIDSLVLHHQKSNGIMHVFAFEAKKNYRDLFTELLNDSQAFILSENHDETIALAESFFNENSLSMLNRLKPSANINRLHRLLNTFEQWMSDYNLEKEHFCIDGSTWLTIFGVSNVKQLRYFQFGNISHQTSPSLQNYNRFAKFYATTVDDLIFNPNNHFYYKSFKFITTQHFKNMLATRGKWYDKQHLKLLYTLID